MAVYQREINNTEKGEPALIIAADTVVVSHFGDILEKPRSEREHIEMLKLLRDQREHKVYTAVACMAPLENAVDPGYALEYHVEETLVKFDRESKHCSDSITSKFVHILLSNGRPHSRIRSHS
jgi:septum formation protein